MVAREKATTPIAEQILLVIPGTSARDGTNSYRTASDFEDAATEMNLHFDTRQSGEV